MSKAGDTAKRDIFDYIEIFYDPTRKHTNNRMSSQLVYESKPQEINKAGI